MNNSVPQGWKRSIFADVVKLDYGKSPKDIFNENGKYPVIGTGGVTGFTDGFLHQGNTTVIGRKGTINNPSFITTKFWPIDTTYFVSEHKNADPKWFYYLVQNIDLTKFNEASGVPSLNRETLYAIPHVLPPFPEQQKIAAILTAVDDVIESTQTQINKLKDLKTGMMQELLTKGIGHTEFKPLPKWLIGKIAEIDQIPTTWKLANILTVAKLESGHTPSRDVPQYWGGKFPWVSLHDTKQLGVREIYETNLYITQEGLDNSSARLLPKGTIAFSRTASVGHCVIFGREMATSQDFANYICGPELFNRYLMHLFKWMQHVWSNLAEGSTHQTIYMPVFKRLQILVPPLAEQIKIAAAADKIVDTLLEAEKKLTTYKDLKKALMQDLLTGKVRVKVS